MRYLAFALLLGMSSDAIGFDDEPVIKKGRDDDGRKGLLIADLDATLDGRDVTVRFTVAELQGVAQRYEPGQSPTFVIKTKPETGTKGRLRVWVAGELTNVLHRLQMGFLQENQLETGTTILAKGRLAVHVKDPTYFTLEVNRWQTFRILPSNVDGQEEQSDAPATSAKPALNPPSTPRPK